MARRTLHFLPTRSISSTLFTSAALLLSLSPQFSLAQVAFDCNCSPDNPANAYCGYTKATVVTKMYDSLCQLRCSGAYPVRFGYCVDSSQPIGSSCSTDVCKNYQGLAPVVAGGFCSQCQWPTFPPPGLENSPTASACVGYGGECVQLCTKHATVAPMKNPVGKIMRMLTCLVKCNNGKCPFIPNPSSFQFRNFKRN